jgi:hypothetical protein
MGFALSLSAQLRAISVLRVADFALRTCSNGSFLLGFNLSEL